MNNQFNAWLWPTAANEAEQRPACADELAYTNWLITQDVRNNSAWNHRYQTVAHTTTFADRNTLNTEIE